MYLLKADGVAGGITANEPNAVNQRDEITVSGVVQDANGEGLPGVSVSIPGSSIGTMTDLEGNYTLKVPTNSEIQFSYIGYATQTARVTSSGTVNIVMNDDTKLLDEIVVVGFGTQKRVNLTGAVSTVDTKALESRPVSNVAQSLQGLVPGLNINQNNGGEIGTSPGINIRGMTTIGQGSSGNPLILIDGMEGDIATLNPNDIQNISILKDAAASSIYGSRAPFGVILITTKEGKSGKIQVNYNNNLRWSRPTSTPHFVDSYTYALFMNELEKNSGNGPHFNAEHLQRIKDYQEGKLGNKSIIPNPDNPEVWADGYAYGNDNVDWYDAFYKKGAFSQEHSMSISGGNDMASYYLSGNYMDQGGLLKIAEDGLKRYTATAKITSQIAPWAKIDYNGKFTRIETTRPQTYRGQNDFWFASQGWPTLPLYDPNGYYYSSPSAALFIAEGGTNDYTSDRNTHQLGLTLEPIKNWKIIGNLNYAVTDSRRKVIVNKLYNHNVAGDPILYDGGNSIEERAEKTNYFNADVRSEFSKSFNEEHNFSLMAGFQAEKSKYRDLGGSKVGILTDGQPSINTSSGYDNWGNLSGPWVSGQYINWSTAGFFGRLNYDYLGRYLLEANIRYDGTSRFRSDKRWNWFPSVSLGWNIAQEAFWDNLRGSVDMLKLRASWGKLGNQNTTNNYPTYSQMNLGSSNGNWLVDGKRPNTAGPASLISYALTWEKIETYNVGLDVSALNNRLTASFDTYVRNTKDMVGPAIDLPAVLGTAVPAMNNTDLRTSGLEFEIAWRDKLSNGLGYNVRFNVSDSKTKIVKYPNDAKLLGFEMHWQGYVNYTRYRDGERYGEIWGYETVGLAKTQGEMDAHLATMNNGAQNALGTNWGAGDIMYRDLDGDGKVDSGSGTIDDHGDLKVIGNITPRYTFGINLGADYKGFDLSMFFQGVMKRDYFIGSYFFWGSNGKSKWDSTCFEEHLDYFRADADNPLGQNLDAYYPRPLATGDSGGKNNQVQTRYLQNAAYIRLKMLQVGYSLPSSVLNKIKMQKVRLYVSGENLWTGTNLSKIFDPELIDRPGSGGVQYPLSKVFSFGINVTF